METFLYSQTILTFLKKVFLLAGEILRKEMTLFSKGHRFIYKKTSYPLTFIVFEHHKRMGFFNPDTYEIGINKKAMLFFDQNELKNLIRHELGHYISFIQYGSYTSAHGKEYHKICQSYGWGKEVFSATMPFSSHKTEQFNCRKLEKILEKIKKLFALGESKNSYESEQATIKANTLLLKHNLNEIHSIGTLKNQDLCEEMALKRILTQRRNSVKLKAICSILKTFFTYPVISHSKKGVYLEIFGKKINIAVAEHVGLYLNEELERIWLKNKKTHPQLKGISQKNSFLQGLAQGYCEKIDLIQTHYPSHEKKAIVSFKKELSSSVSMAYPRLSSHTSSYQRCEKALQLGCKEGKNLYICPSITPSPSTKTNFLLQHSTK